MLKERIEAYETTGCELLLRYVEGEFSLYGNDYDLPLGRKVISRLDDDDSICKEFCETIYSAASGKNEHCITWPTGYVFWRNALYLLTHPYNQFPSLVTSGNSTPHDRPHQWYARHMPTAQASDKPGWIWVRHGIAMSSTRSRYRPTKVNRIQSERFGINLRAVVRAIEPLGMPSCSYAEHRQMMQDRGIHYEDMVGSGCMSPRKTQDETI